MTLKNWLNKQGFPNGMECVGETRLQQLWCSAKKEEQEKCANILNLSRSDALLMAGEMTAQEWRTVAAVLRALQAQMRSDVEIEGRPAVGMSLSNAGVGLLPCPFCGKTVDLEDCDTLYPIGLYWREEGGIRHYVRHEDRKEGDERVWGMHCPEVSGGCGAEITADSKQDAISAWNRRA